MEPKETTSSDTVALCLEQEEPTSGSPIGQPPAYYTIPGTVPLYQGRQSGPPPTYDDVTNPDAPPPSYNSLFGQVQEAKRSSSGFVDFLRRVIIIIFGTLGCTICIGTTIVIPIAMIAIGSSHLHDCTVEPYIPIYLIVGGVFGVFKNFRNCCVHCYRSDEEQQNQQQNRPQDSLLNCFLFAWFIAGCVWVYRVYEPEYEDVTSERYCNRVLYQFSFWLLTSAYIMLGLLSCGLCCLTFSALLSRQE